LSEEALPAFTAYVVVTGLTAAANTYAANADFTRPKWLRGNMAKARVPQSWLFPLGALKAAGALGLLAGIAVAPVGFAASIGLILFFIGAVITRVATAYRAEGPRFDPSTRRRPLGEGMDLERGSSTVVRPPRRRSGGRPMSDLGLDLSAVALARGLKRAGAEAVTTSRGGQTTDGGAPEPSEEQRQLAWGRPSSGRAKRRSACVAGPSRVQH
jgi:hypothetical protein